MGEHADDPVCCPRCGAGLAERAGSDFNMFTGVADPSRFWHCPGCGFRSDVSM